MTPLLGKRKRRSQLIQDEECSNSSVADAEHQQLQVILRKNFEANFEPLPITENATALCIQHEEQAVDEGEEMTWEGISNTEKEPANIVQHIKSSAGYKEVPKEELKSFMVCRA